MEHTLKTIFEVVETRTGRLYDGPLFSLVNASRIASDANERARAANSPLRYVVKQS
jgi:hypothetical protein